MGASISTLTTKSTSKYLLSDSNLYRREREVLEFAGIPMNFIQSLNVRVDDYDGKPVYIRTQLIDLGHSSDKPVLVFVHGYAASGSLYYQIFKGLSEKFHIIITDIIGMGASSRPQNYHKNTITP